VVKCHLFWYLLFSLCEFDGVVLKKRCELLSFYIYIYCFSVCTQVYTKLRWNTLTHGTYINTSGFGKQMATILNVYFRFRFWPFRPVSHRDVILRLCSEFRPDRSAGRVMTSCLFFMMAATAPQINFRFWVWSHNSLIEAEGYVRTRFGRNRSIYVWVKNYFRFRKTNDCHIGFLFPVSILTIRCTSGCHLCTKFHLIWTTAGRVLRRHMHFSRWRPSAIWVWYDMVDHPRSVFSGLHLTFKFRLDPILFIHLRACAISRWNLLPDRKPPTYFDSGWSDSLFNIQLSKAKLRKGRLLL